MKCPIDNETLIMTERSDVEIDYCPKCRGIWLDRGELDKIIERSVGTPNSAPTQTAQRYEGQERGQKPYRKKKESFLSELFDF
ncbi:hypothetical protein JCM17846_02470 [Iodidimonas nitroreducens]|uniref:Transcription factor zinc-finger domain-containing protein n=1 Tax=Iodidimonas nitroreducens TaxID=1236968 RepID=A0A5A7N4C3_9PROT|nr:zf-TFIIB domain-containing protein [Iodidimonas nitroreducens]GAK34734.1 hypothetical protein AQ1_02639 [alpha proteobacterium Q-1]GER02565.1 hypothetical protein JCM17846_02470 [Iodidimonas nitroreducens]